MVNVLEFNKYLNAIFSGSTELQALVGEKIYPIILPEETQLPAIIFKRKFTNNYTKDWYSGSEITVELTVLTEKYSDTVTISKEIDEVLSANNFKLISGYEQYIDGIYIQELEYTLTWL